VVVHSFKPIWPAATAFPMRFAAVMPIAALPTTRARI
jgi:hypothetical protein